MHRRGISARRYKGKYVSKLKVKRKVRLLIYRIQRLGVLLDDVRRHLAL